jgi:lipoyl(octanoyl) transferase
MALDEALLDSAIAGGPPVLRIYAWEPPAVSLGYFQLLDDSIDRDEIARRGFGLVRRPTGGRAILHKDEVTYSVTAREEHLSGGRSLMGSYRTISRGIETGLHLLGVAAQMAERSGQARAQHRSSLPTVCFSQSAKVDMVADGRKIVGSAQTRRAGALLQHGSIPVAIDEQEHLAVMPGGAAGQSLPQQGGQLSEAACGIADVLGRVPSFEEVARALATGFAEALQVTVTPSEVSEDESRAVERLLAEKYDNDAWTARAGKRSERAN